LLILLVAGLVVAAVGVLVNVLENLRIRQRSGVRSDEQASVTLKGLSVTLKGAGLALIVPGLVAVGFAGLKLADMGPHIGTSPPGTSPPTTTQVAPGSPASSAAWLDELSPVDGQTKFTGVFVLAGRDVPHGVGFDTYGNEPRQVTYDIGGHYSELQVALAIGDIYKAPAHLDILGDGTSLLSGGVDVTPNGQVINKAVNVTGVRRLKLVATVASGEAQAMFANPRLVP
jgi:hypothetical protein